MRTVVPHSCDGGEGSETLDSTEPATQGIPQGRAVGETGRARAG